MAILRSPPGWSAGDAGRDRRVQRCILFCEDSRIGSPCRLGGTWLKSVSGTAFGSYWWEYLKERLPGLEEMVDEALVKQLQGCQRQNGEAWDLYQSKKSQA